MLYRICESFYHYVYWQWVRPVWRIFLQWFTGRCELLRITDSSLKNHEKTLQIEKCLRDCQISVVQNAIQWSPKENLDHCLSQILTCKQFVPNDSASMKDSLKQSLTQIHGYQQLMFQLDITRGIPYSSNNEDHEDLLNRLWRGLRPGVALTSRISKQWDDIGFQGDDPMTDFRGMGILGLQNLVFFAEEFPKKALHALSHSHHPEHGYSFAIVGINLTALSLDFLNKGMLKKLFYKTVEGRPTLRHFNQFYSFVFTSFDEFWWKEQPNIMEFSRVRNDFKISFTQRLSDDGALDTIKEDYFLLE